MHRHRFASRTVGRRDVGFVLAWILAVVALIPVQFASMIVFDELGLDVLVPYPVFMAAVPGIVLAGIPTVVALRFYGRRTASITAAIAVAVFVLGTGYTTQFYGFCGPGC